MLTLIFIIISAFYCFIYIFPPNKSGETYLNKDHPIYRYYVKEFWSKSFDFNGRIERNIFLKTILINILIALYVNFFVISISIDLDYDFSEYVYILSIPIIYSFLAIIPSISIQIRRLRDVGVKPILILLGFIPLVNFVLLFWSLQPSNSYKQNRLKTKASSEESRLEELKSMLDRNVISEEEYKSMRKKTLGL